MTLTFEQRKRTAELIGKRVIGSTRSHLHIDRGDVCPECGGELPCEECESEADVPSQRRSREAPKAETLKRYTRDTAARHKLRLMASEAGYTPELKRDSIAEARRSLAERKRRAANPKRYS
jgi:hypothetical protein